MTSEPSTAPPPAAPSITAPSVPAVAAAVATSGDPQGAGGGSPAGAGTAGSGGGAGAGTGGGRGPGDGPGDGAGNGAERARTLALIRERIAAHRRYPDLARRRGIEGTVLVGFRIRRDGAVADVSIRRGVDPTLDEAAAEAVSDAAPLPPLDGPLVIEIDFHFARRGSL